MAFDEDLLIDMLVNIGLISEAQSEEVLRISDESGKEVIKVLEELDYASELDVLNVMATEYGMETFDLSEYKVPDDVLALVPAEVAKHFKVVPVMRHDAVLTVAMSDPTALDTLDSLRYMLKCDIDAVISRKEDIKKAVDRYYGTAEDAVDSVMQEVTSEVDITMEMDAAMSGDSQTDDAPIIRLVGLLIIEAYKQRGSDIHLEPMEKRFRVRYRVDGVLIEVEGPPKYLQNNIIQRLKIMASLDITEKRVPQDGRINFKMPGKQIDLRVSTVPTVHGESIVMRILDQSSINLGIPELGFFADDQKMIEGILALPDGIFLVTGPTGSGKTTSLYAFLNTLNTPNRKIITAEDPVEYELSGINQVQCENAIGMTFGRALRAMLRQAPNIVMVGEIRDIETGAIAINAALTGHLVFSTLHTNDAPTAVTRMIDMGVKPFLVASAVRAVMAQRLVRRNCKHCTVPVQADPEELRLLEIEPGFFKDSNLRRGKGCNECKLGYRGRMGLYEIFYVDKLLVPLILDSAPSDQIKAKARELGMRTLRDDGVRKAGTGMTTLEEVIRITKADEEDEEEAVIAVAEGS